MPMVLEKSKQCLNDDAVKLVVKALSEYHEYLTIRGEKMKAGQILSLERAFEAELEGVGR